MSRPKPELLNTYPVSAGTAGTFTVPGHSSVAVEPRHEGVFLRWDTVDGVVAAGRAIGRVVTLNSEAHIVRGGELSRLYVPRVAFGRRVSRLADVEVIRVDEPDTHTVTWERTTREKAAQMLVFAESPEYAAELIDKLGEPQISRQLPAMVVELASR